MKKVTICLALLLPILGFSQKKKNGTIYIEHPAIDLVDAFTKAWVVGDTASMSKMMTGDFKAFNRVDATPYDKGLTKSVALNNAMVWFNQLDYFSIETMPGSYPDAFEYDKDPAFDRAVTVESWDVLKGVHKVTGVKADMILHRSFEITKDNKINNLVNYINPELSNNVGRAYSTIKNGTIYSQHKHINSLRLLIGAVEHEDQEKAMSYYHKDAVFIDANNVDDEPLTLVELMAKSDELLIKYELVGIEQVGYPDYMEYDMGSTGVLYSWWNYHFRRKSDNEEIKLPVHYQHDVGEDGKFVRRVSYFNPNLLK